MTMKNETLGTFALDVHSKMISEFDYVIGFRLIQGNNPTDATVETTDSNDPIFNGNFDALFGDRANPNNQLDLLETERILEKGHHELLNPLFINIIPDMRSEPDECFTINIFNADTDGDGTNFMCNKNDDNPEDFFCDHTLCILNDDG